MTTTLSGEWTKLTTLRAPAVVAGLAVAFLVGIGAVRVASTSDPLRPDQLLDGAGMGMLTVVALAAVTAAAYHSSGVHALTLLADPRRGRVALARLLAISGWTGLAGVCASAGLALLAFAGPSVVSEWSAIDVRAVCGPVLTWPLCGVFGAAVGMLTRRAALSAVGTVMLPVMIEPALCMAPKVGPNLGTWLPFLNAVQFYSSSTPPVSAHHEGVAGLAVFAAWVLAAGALAVLVERRRAA